MEYITNTDTSILPYNDVNMVYNLTKRQYELTQQGFEDYTGLKLSEYTDSPNELKAFLMEISDDVYEYIYGLSTFTGIDYKRYVIAKNGDIREDFKNVLVNHARASLRSGMNLLKDMHGFNIEKSKSIPISRGYLGGNAIMILSRLGLLYSGMVMMPTGYSDDGTF